MAMESTVEEDVPTCKHSFGILCDVSHPLFSDTSIESPSLLPPRHYCDITGLGVRVPRLVSFCDPLIHRA